MSVRAIILQQIDIVAAQQHKILKPLSDDLHLIDSGLDSLCLAILVANLDDELGLDPFGTGDDVPIPVTVGDLITLYENAEA
jgi:acyl carrier protein